MSFYTGNRIEDGYRNFFLFLALVAEAGVLYFYGPPLGGLGIMIGKIAFGILILLYLAFFAAIIRTWWQTRNINTRKGGVSTN